MPYDPTVWVEDQTKLGPTNMNHIEAGIAAAFEAANVDTDATLAADSDSLVASQKATKTYVNSRTSPYDIRNFGATTASSDNAAEIQDAIDAAYTAGGGDVYVPTGVFIVGSPLTLKYRVNLVGDGTTYNEGTTAVFSTLKLKNAADTNILEFDQVNGPVRGALGQRWQNSLIRGVYFDGNRSQQTTEGYCLDMENVWGVDIVNCCVRNAYVSNWYAENCNEVHVSNSFFVSASTGECVNWVDVRDSSIDSTCQIGGGTTPFAMRYSLYGCNFNSISGFFFNGQTGSGITVPDAESVGNRFVNVRCDQNFQHGMYLKGQYTTVSGYEAHMNGWNNSGQVVGGIYLDGTDVAVTGAVCFDGGSDGNQDYGVILSTNVDRAFVSGSFNGNLSGAFNNGSSNTSITLIDSGSSGQGRIRGASFLGVSASGGVGYAAGAGGTETQGTSKSTSVTVSPATVTGTVTMHNANLAAGASVAFSLSNSQIGTNDVVVVNLVDGYATTGTYEVKVLNTGTAGSPGGIARIRVTNISGGDLAEALVLQYVIIKGAAS